MPVSSTQFLRLLLVAPVLILSFSHQVNAQTPDIRQSELVQREVVQSLRQHLNQLTAEKKFSGAVLLAKGNEILLKEGYESHESRGLDQHAKPRSINPGTKFYLASVTKVFTAVAILQLAQQRKFTLDDTLISVLPDYPNKDAAAKITIRHLLTHRSGLCNGFDKFAQLDFARHTSLESFLSVFANEPLESTPGTRYSYSNAGYLVLGVIVQKVSGESYEQYVENHIFKPSRMKDSEWLSGETRGLNAIGGGRSTVEDLFRFSRALQEGKLISNDFTALELSGGAGLTAEKTNGTEVVGHIGGAPGMSTVFDIYPALGFTVVVLSAQDGAALPVRDEFRKQLTRR